MQEPARDHFGLTNAQHNRQGRTSSRRRQWLKPGSLLKQTLRLRHVGHGTDLGEYGGRRPNPDEEKRQ